MVKFNITVSKTTSGYQDYIQILSEDMTVNIVLIADEIKILDVRAISTKNKSERRNSHGKT